MRIGDCLTTTRTIDHYYVIGWEQDEAVLVPRKNPKPHETRYTKSFRRKTAFYKAGSHINRNSDSFRSEYYAVEAKNWKTFAGASKALARLTVGQDGPEARNAQVLRYTGTELVQSFLLPADSE